jgi:hypothetical protein
LILANTWGQSSAGPTWFGPNSQSRIDYVGVPGAAWHSVIRCKVLYECALRLQKMNAPVLRDHCPVLLELWHRDWHEVDETGGRNMPWSTVRLEKLMKDDDEAGWVGSLGK